jgi:serine phosphatase RsbU (regulator of sigma subunit)
MAFYASNKEKKVFHKVLIHQLKRLFDDDDETSVEDYLRAKFDQIKSEKSVAEKEAIIALLLSFMNDVSSTYDQFNKSLLLKSRSIAQRSDELEEANEKLSKNDQDISKSVVNLKGSLIDLLGKKNEDELNFEEYDLEELTKLIKSLIHKNKTSAKKLKRNNKKLKQQSAELVAKTNNIVDGIEYAKRMQDTILPSTKLLNLNFQESFILNLPKEIVSGDFFWIHRIKNKVILALADCTGHGVPGAFTSIISTMALNEIVVMGNTIYPSEILKKMHQRIVQIFRLDEKNAHSHDGLDIAICTVDLENDLLQFAGAGRPIVMHRNGRLNLLRGVNKSVGGFISDKIPEFHTHEISLEQDDLIYLFSDGFSDQFGGPEGLKFSNLKFRELLGKIASESCLSQAEKLHEAHLQWKGKDIQVDDILVVGFRYQIN